MAASISPSLASLADAHGIATEFWDWKGQHTAIDRDTLITVLAALDVDAHDDDTAEAAWQAHLDRRWTRLLPPVVVARQFSGATFEVHVRDGASVNVWIDLESGGHAEPNQIENWESPRVVAGTPRGEASFAVPDDLPLGYHTLYASSEGEQSDCLLIVTPDHLDVPDALGDDRTWGFALQLYSITSAGSWGMGDLADLAELGAWSASHGAGYILINPLHAAEPVAPVEPSPYLPSSRRFANPLYLRVEDVPEYAALSAELKAQVDEIGADLRARLADVDGIDRDSILAAKMAALRIAFDHGLDHDRGQDLSWYIERQGNGLADFATWCVLAGEHGPDHSQWPDELRDPRSPGVVSFAAAHAREIEFHCWLQWQLDEQLRDAQEGSEDAGMALGIMHDLAVGVNPDGADTWALGDVFASGVTVGSPPDAFNQLGQNWSQPPWRPDRLAERGYAPFRDMVHDILRHSGGIRVDHVMGLFRLWWVPAGASPKQGTYVRYDHDAMVGILALEAQRAGSLVVGEDLGTVEPWVRDYLAGRGIFGTSILWWELDHEGDGRPLAPERWREACLASVTTHDLTPTTGFLAGDHVLLREKLGQLTNSLEDELRSDRAERAAWLRRLKEDGLLPADFDEEGTSEEDLEQVVLALHRFLVRTRARLLGPALTDAVGDRRTVNLPGTTDEYPNWRVPMTDAEGRRVTVESVQRDPRVARLVEVFAGLNG